MTPGTEELPTEMGAVAGKLTEAQRKAVLGKRDLSQGPGMWPLRNALGDMGLVEGWDARWTPLGLDLRAHLQANPIPNSDSKEEGR